MIYIILILSSAVLAASESTVDDTPFSNFTQQLPGLKEPCQIPSAKSLAKDKSEYEGRWYIVYVGFVEKQAKTVTCLVLDGFFDKNGNYHAFINLKEDGINKEVVANKKVFEPEKGIYDLDLGLKDSPEMKATLFYVDKEMIAFWDGMYANETSYSQAMIGFRDVDSKSKKSIEVADIYASLLKKGAPSEKHEISHKNCDYPPEMENPYQKNKSKN